MPAHLIAVIDDDPPTTEMLSEALTLKGYRVVVCLSQVEAVSIIQRERPDLVLLDLWITTSTGGWTILADLAHDPNLATIPVIICTALPSRQIQPPPDLQSVPNVILQKPFELDHLFSIINTALRV